MTCESPDLALGVQESGLFLARGTVAQQFHE
jgi:hypothetical protein